MKKLFVLLTVYTSVYLFSIAISFAYECDLQNITFDEVSEFNYSFNKPYAIDYDATSQRIYIAEKAGLYWSMILILSNEPK